MASRFEIDPNGEQEILRLVDNMFETKLGPAMKAEVIRNTPVDTGALAESTYMEVDRANHVLNVGAIGDETRVGDNRKFYAAYVDLGHRIWLWGHPTDRIQPATAYMRRVLYKRWPGF